MQIKGVIKSLSKRKVVIETLEDIDIGEVNKHRRGNGLLYGVFETYDKDTISELQRRHYFALIGDFSSYTGYPFDASDAYFRIMFMEEYGLEDYPSLKRNKMTLKTATIFISFLLDYFIENEIPFKYQEFYLTADVSRYLFAMTMKRLCWICGKPSSDIHHVDTVGMGRDRTSIDHTKHRFMCLCREHHQVAHATTLAAFCDKYHIKPIKLSKYDLVNLGIMSAEEASKEV